MSQRPLERRVRAAAAPALRRRTTRLSGSRPDRVAAWAFVLGIFLILVAATTSRGDSGGALAPPPPGVAGPAAGAATEAELGERVLSAGSAGPDVAYAAGRFSQTRGYAPLTLTGVFDDAHRRRGEALPARGRPGCDGVVGPQTRPPLVRLMRYRRATWYGPGLYGNRTACGKRLRPGTLGRAPTSRCPAARRSRSTAAGAS